MLVTALVCVLLGSFAPESSAAPGELDTSFTSGGFNTTEVTAVAPVADGDTYVAGSFSAYGSSVGLHGVVRLNADGSVDPSFSMAGTGLDVGSKTNGYQIVAVNATGGTFTLTFQGQTTANIAYNADAGTMKSALEALSNIGVGEVDVSKTGSAFNLFIGGVAADSGTVPLFTSNPAGLTGGTQTAAVSSVGYGKTVTDIEVLEDGDLIVVGTFSSYNGIARRGIARLNSDGSLDSSLASTAGAFGCSSDGSPSGCFLQSPSAEAVAALPDGDFLVGGQFDRYAATSGINNLARINSDGSLDSAFNSGAAGTNGIVRGLDLEASGTTAVIAGDFTSYNGASNTARVARLAVSDGTAAAPALSQGTGFNSSASSVHAKLDGKILVGGIFGSYDGSNRSKLAMLQSSGVLDPTFGDPGLTGWVDAIEVGQDGKALAAGLFKTTTVPQKGNPMRFLPSGAPDPAFDSGSGATQGVNPSVTDLAPAPDGSIWIVGGFDTYDGNAGVGQGVAKVLNVRQLRYTKAGSGAGTVQSSPSGVSCVASCQEWFDEASSVTLSATPAAGSTFTGWSGDCTGLGTCSVGLTQARSVTATFAKQPAKPKVKWSYLKSKRTIKAQVTRVTGVTYTLKATKGKTIRAGKCKLNTKTKKIDCTARLSKGTWKAAVTPKASGLVGVPATKQFRVR